MKKYIKAMNYVGTTNKNGKKYFFVDYEVDKNKLFYGVPDVYLIYIHDWTDPYVEYQGNLYNYYELEDMLWSDYNEVCEEDGVEPSEDDFETNFVTPDSVYNVLYDMIPDISKEYIQTDGHRKYAVKLERH